MNVNEFFRDIKLYFGSLSLYEEIAWGLVGIGFLMIIISLVLFF